MSDYFYGSIEIGGKLPATDVPAFIKALNYEGFEQGTTTLATGKSLEYSDEQATYGTFPDLETFCQKHGLTFTRKSSGKYEFDPEEVHWEPGMKEPEVMYTLEDGKEILTQEGLTQKFKKVESLMKKFSMKEAPLHINSRDTLKKTFARYMLKHGKKDAYEIVKEYLCNGVGNDNTVPPFEIV